MTAASNQPVLCWLTLATLEINGGWPARVQIGQTLPETAVAAINIAPPPANRRQREQQRSTVGGWRL